jgi:hypothetical protein
MKRREDIILRIEKLKTKPVENVKLIRKWERILRNYDKLQD